VVQKFDGTAWVNVGAAGISPVEGRELVLIFDGNSPCIGYIDGSSAPQPSRASVKKFNGTVWQSVGDVYLSPSSAGDFALTASNGVIYACFADPSQGEKVAVMKYGTVISPTTELDESKLRIYPSLTKDLIKLETDFVGDYLIVNSIGQVVQTGKISSQIDVSKLLAGMYVLKVEGIVRKFVKE
jgi:hypothetical protein